MKSEDKQIESSSFLVVDFDDDIESSNVTMKGVFAAISYMACAVLLVIFNKTALSSFRFPCANVITLLQMLTSCLLLYALRSLNVIQFTNEQNKLDSSTTTLTPIKKLVLTLPVAISYLLYMVVSMESIRITNVPMYTTLRRTTVAFTMLAEYIITRRKQSPYIISSVLVIIMGAFVAGARDLSYDSYGYSIVIIANIATSIYLACISHIGKYTDLNSFGLMWYKGLICAPILLLWTYFRGDWEVAITFPYIYNQGFQVVMVLSCLMAFLLNYTVFLNTTLNSALTQAVCGNLKDLFTVAFGWLIFGGLPFDPWNIVGQCLGFLGSGLYAYYKLKGYST